MPSAQKPAKLYSTKCREKSLFLPIPWKHEIGHCGDIHHFRAFLQNAPQHFFSHNIRASKKNVMLRIKNIFYIFFLFYFFHRCRSA